MSQTKASRPLSPVIFFMRSILWPEIQRMKGTSLECASVTVKWNNIYRFDFKLLHEPFWDEFESNLSFIAGNLEGESFSLCDKTFWCNKRNFNILRFLRRTKLYKPKNLISSELLWEECLHVVSVCYQNHPMFVPLNLLSFKENKHVRMWLENRLLNGCARGHKQLSSIFKM